MLQQVVVSPRVTPRSVRGSGRQFYAGIAVFMIVLNIASFAPSLVEPSMRTVPLPLTTTVMLHTAVSIAWLLLFLAQTLLAASGRTHVHRRLGVVGVVLAAAFVVVGWNAVVGEARRGFDLSGDLVPKGTTIDPAASLVLLNQFVLFAILVAIAVWFRHRSEVHKRLMALLMLGCVSGASVAHLIGHFALPGALAAVAGFGLPLAVPVHDRVADGRVHPAAWWGYAGIAVWGVVFFGVVPGTGAWRTFSAWLVS